MLTVYVRNGCPFCAKVLEVAEDLGINLNLKNIADEGVEEELIARGGKVQTPYLVDNEHNKEFYESDAIIAYLHEKFTPKV